MLLDLLNRLRFNFAIVFIILRDAGKKVPRYVSQCNTFFNCQHTKSLAAIISNQSMISDKVFPLRRAFRVVLESVWLTESKTIRPNVKCDIPRPPPPLIDGDGQRRQPWFLLRWILNAGPMVQQGINFRLAYGGAFRIGRFYIPQCL